jgi:hypothetical protein
LPFSEAKWSIYRVRYFVAPKKKPQICSKKKQFFDFKHFSLIFLFYYAQILSQLNNLNLATTCTSLWLSNISSAVWSVILSCTDQSCMIHSWDTILHYACSLSASILHWSIVRPPLWSSGQSSWLQIRRPGFDFRYYQKKKEWIRNGVHSASGVQLRSYLIEK